MSVGLPIVANYVGGWSKIIRDEGVGVVTGGSPEKFAEGIIRLLSNKEFSRKCGQRALNLVREKYNWNVSANILKGVYERVAGVK